MSANGPQTKLTDEKFMWTHHLESLSSIRDIHTPGQPCKLRELVHDFLEKPDLFSLFIATIAQLDDLFSEAEVSAAVYEHASQFVHKEHYSKDTLWNMVNYAVSRAEVARVSLAEIIMQKPGVFTVEVQGYKPDATKSSIMELINECAQNNPNNPFWQKVIKIIHFQNRCRDLTQLEEEDVIGHILDGYQIQCTQLSALGYKNAHYDFAELMVCTSSLQQLAIGAYKQVPKDSIYYQNSQVKAVKLAMHIMAKIKHSKQKVEFEDLASFAVDGILSLPESIRDKYTQKLFDLMLKQALEALILPGDFTSKLSPSELAVVYQDTDLKGATELKRLVADRCLQAQYQQSANAYQPQFRADSEQKKQQEADKSKDKSDKIEADAPKDPGLKLFQSMYYGF